MSFPEEPDILTGKALIHQRNALKSSLKKINNTPIKPFKNITYRAIPVTNKKFKEFKPFGFYEDASKGCPSRISEEIGFKLSDIPELCFSKSPEATIIAMKESSHKDSVIDIYMTNNIPDLDLSDCDYDFSVLEEVRFRDTVPVKFFKRIRILHEFIQQVRNCYNNESVPDDLGLDILKSHVKKELKKGNTINPISLSVFNKQYAKKHGFSTVEELNKYFNNSYDKNWIDEV